MYDIQDDNCQLLARAALTKSNIINPKGTLAWLLALKALNLVMVSNFKSLTSTFIFCIYKTFTLQILLIKDLGHHQKSTGFGFATPAGSFYSLQELQCKYYAVIDSPSYPQRSS